MFQIEQKNIKPTDSAIFMMSFRRVRLKHQILSVKAAGSLQSSQLSRMRVNKGN